jgi:hypothetical protein
MKKINWRIEKRKKIVKGIIGEITLNASLVMQNNL